MQLLRVKIFQTLISLSPGTAAHFRSVAVSLQALFFSIGKHWLFMPHPPVTHTLLTQQKPTCYVFWSLLDHHKHQRHFHQRCQENWEYVSLLLLPLLLSWLLLQQQNKKRIMHEIQLLFMREWLVLKQDRCLVFRWYSPTRL